MKWNAQHIDINSTKKKRREAESHLDSAVLLFQFEGHVLFVGNVLGVERAPEEPRTAAHYVGWIVPIDGHSLPFGHANVEAAAVRLDDFGRRPRADVVWYFQFHKNIHV